MTTAKIQLNDANNYGTTTGAWVVVLPSDTTPKAITDENGDPTGWTIRWASAALAPGAAGGEGYNGVGVGEAAWADEANVLRRAVFFNSFSGEPYCELIIEGPEVLTIDAVGSYQGSTSHQDTEVAVNSETPQVMLTYDVANSRGNNSDAVTFADVAKNGSNQFSVRFKNNSGDRGYISGLRLTSPAGPALQITGDLTPGSSFTINYTGFTGVPVSPATFTDSAGNSITVAVTISDNGDGTGTASGTMPALPSSGSVSGLKFGTVTASLSTA